MTTFSQEFKIQSVEKALSKSADQTLKNIADDLRVGYSTLQTWIRLAKKNKLDNPEKICQQKKALRTGLKRNAFSSPLIHYQYCYNSRDESIASFQ